MGNVLFSVVSFVVALGILITVHEFGHYWVARRLGVKVLRFSIGFGKPIWRTTRGKDQTEYVVSVLPLGGYVKMLDEREGEVAPEELGRAFNRKPVASRFAIVSAGPVFNFLLAILLYWLIFIVGLPGLKPVVGEVEPGSAAALSGLKPGDEIIAVDQTRTPTLETVRLALLEAVLDRDEVEVKVAQPDEVFRIVSLDLRPAKSKKLESGIMQHLGFTPKRPTIPPVIDRLEEGGPAAKAGLRPGDRVIAVDGEPMRDWMEWAEYIRKRPGRLLQVTVDRNGQRLQIDLVPARLESAGGAIGRIGAAPAVPQELPPAFQAEQKYSPLPAVAASVGKTWDMSALTLRMLWRMLVGQASLENLSGPISIAQVAGETAKVGAVPFLSFLAIVSISLGVLNLLPVPVLDGGHLMYYLVEIVKGRPISEHAQVIGQKIGLVLLLGLMFLAFYNDITRLLR